MVPEITVSLFDLPRNRWRLSEQQVDWAGELIRRTVDEVGDIAPYKELLTTYSSHFVKDEYIAEIEGLAAQSGTDFIQALAANLYYDFVKLLLGCTAFAVNTDSGPIHARNMDWFSHNNSLSEFTTIVNFVESDGKLRFQSVGWPGSVSVLSGMAPGRFTVTLNAVLSDEPIQAATSSALLIREVCQIANNYEEAVNILSTRPITSDCLLLVTGTRRGEMAVIERTPTRSAIRTTEEDFLVVTNDYRALDCNGGDATGDIYETACGRFDAASRCLSSKLPTCPDECFEILDDSNVKMQITVQQMVMCARTGELKVKTTHHR
ncbi:C45 family autoproteolytic acyltransferase/hydolase [Gimesia algae]|uniref:Acyl-coenzyme A:6-aminopenicillanic acid acyl-transferase n=1 Tax=Gimesia algae TaxID=2527971 RepID=A0A517VFI0_9PLAN|nr:C45 family peptidase [Gimesia algae]QDT91761.1 Acyl-coenzyme A:6-aminopenicillanic acid acyl-transferase [Gimesia algae]